MRTLIKIVSIFALSSILGCSDVREYSMYSTDVTIEDSDDCKEVYHFEPGKIKINTTFNYIKADVHGQDKRKFKIESYRYSYSPFYFRIFGRKKGARSITVICENGYKFYISYGSFCILSLPEDDDSDYCDGYIFYDL